MTLLHTAPHGDGMAYGIDNCIIIMFVWLTAIFFILRMVCSCFYNELFRLMGIRIRRQATSTP